MKSLNTIYNQFEEKYKKIFEYYEFSSLSFALVGTMQNQVKECAKSHFKFPVKKTEMSYSTADLQVKNTVLDCEWISLQEYSNREKIPLDALEEQAEAGLLGKVHAEGAEKYIIWPKERQQATCLPKFGEKQFEVKIEQTVESTIAIENSDQALALLGRYQSLDSIIDQSRQQLCPTCLLLYWTIFEEFVKDFIVTLYMLYPEKALQKYGKNEMSLKAIFDGSQKFTDIISLKRKVLDIILAKYDSENSHENVSKIIEFVRDCYLSKGDDPFLSQFVYHGEKQEVSKEAIDQIRKIRNSLIHENGKLNEEEWKKIDLVSRKENTSNISITADELTRIYFILKTVAHNLYQMASKQYSETND